MNNVIYSPLEDYESKFKNLHSENVKAFFDELVKKSNVNIEENRATVKEYENQKEILKKLKRKFNFFRFLRVLMIITLILLPLVFLKMTPKIRAMRSEIEEKNKKNDELLSLAYSQMLPLNSLFTSRDCLALIEKTVPLISFEERFSREQEADMIINYDFQERMDTQQSALDLLSGRYNGNPFLFENKLIHTMGMETYHGYKTIYWTEHYTDSEGKSRTRTRSQTLHATLEKPKPFYNTQVVLHYGAQGGPELSFSRDASHLERKSERQIERIVKRGEKRLKKMTDKAIKKNDDFVSMSNTDFEVLFDALDRTNEVQFRTLFTPLAQTNMVDLILSKSGYGDDFNFFKENRMNKIVSNHSQNRELIILPSAYTSYEYDVIERNFTEKNNEYFKSVYFDFAPLFAIPVYQERPVHSLKPLPDFSRLYSAKESEVLANAVDYKYIVHPSTKTKAIVKTGFIKSDNDSDETCITAYSYDIIRRTDYVSVYGGDGRLHSVPVDWDDYIPLEQTNNFFITNTDSPRSEFAIASKNGLCITN